MFHDTRVRVSLQYFVIKVGFQIDHPVLNTLQTEILCLVLDTIGVSHFCYLVFNASKWWRHSQSTGYNSMLPSNWTKEGILQEFIADERANLTVISQANTCADICVCWIYLKPKKRDVLQRFHMSHTETGIAQTITYTEGSRKLWIVFWGLCMLLRRKWLSTLRPGVLRVCCNNSQRE